MLAVVTLQRRGVLLSEISYVAVALILKIDENTMTFCKVQVRMGLTVPGV